MGKLLCDIVNFLTKIQFLLVMASILFWENYIPWHGILDKDKLHGELWAKKYLLGSFKHVLQIYSLKDVLNKSC